MPVIRLAHPNLPGVVYTVPIGDGVELDLTQYRRSGWEIAPPEPDPVDEDDTAGEPQDVKPAGRSRRAKSDGDTTETPAADQPA